MFTGRTVNFEKKIRKNDNVNSTICSKWPLDHDILVLTETCVESVSGRNDLYVNLLHYMYTCCYTKMK